MTDPRTLRVVHVFRAPLGGLFRHVIDLSVAQASRGHSVGLFFDSGGDCERVRAAIARIPEARQLGVDMAPIRRNPGLQDVAALHAFARFLKRTQPEVVHGHGSKGGVYARLSGDFLADRPIRAYTPHGGSFNYAPGSPVHRLYMAVEAMAARRTDLFLFESDHIREKYTDYVGLRAGIARVVVNGLGDREFEPVTPASDATDILYVGELRAAKGIDTLIEALALVARDTGSSPTATLVGSGPDREALAAQAESLGLKDQVRFPGPLPAREAFTKGRLMVAPSRAESMPYIVLETVAAQVPLVTTHVGGIPEIFGPHQGRLGPPDDPHDLARRILIEMRRPVEEQRTRGAELAAYVQSRFSLKNMAETVLSAYGEALARRDTVRISRSGGEAAAQLARRA